MGAPLERAKQDYVAYMPVYMVQDGTAAGADVLSGKEVGVPKFWQKSPTHWATPDNTLSRNCAGCHATGNELCGQCHASHAGKSQKPEGIFKYAFDETYKDTLGRGFFVPGIYDLATFYANFNRPTLNDNWKEGSFHSWPDQSHSRAHSQMLPEFLQSAHVNNPYEKLPCASCHDPHTLNGGPASLVVDGYDFQKTSYSNNTLCLACHASHGPFESVTKDDVAAVHLSAGGQVSKGGQPLALKGMNATLSLTRIANAVGKHMQVGAGMGGALYTPDDPKMPVGNCTSCHMPKIGKL